MNMLYIYIYTSQTPVATMYISIILDTRQYIYTSQMPVATMYISMVRVTMLNTTFMNVSYREEI